MNRLSVVKRAVLGASVALIALVTPRVAMAQAAAQEADPLKFAVSKPTVVGWVVRADKTAEFEDGWKGVRDLVAKSDKDDLKAFGRTLELWKIEQPPFDFPVNGQPVKAVIYLFRLDSPSTTYSYNPRTILYEYLKPGQEGSPVTRAEADGVYAKLGAAFLTINPLWTLTKIGG